jgi:probable FeS assembly SUF system protein SufT
MNQQSAHQQIALARACEVIEIPSGVRRLLPAGTLVRITQALGGSVTITTADGNMYRVDAADAAALGLSAAPLAATQENSNSPRVVSTEQAVWDELRTIFDPEIPVNIADLGLIYSCMIQPLPDDAKRVEIRMTLTAPGCGMADVLKADVERKLLRLAGIKEVLVEVVFEPPWDPSRMSEAAKLQLGLDLDFSPSPSALPIFSPRH